MISILSLDQALQEVTSAEATFIADTNAVANIQTAIDTATAPLPAAQATVAADKAALIEALQGADAAIQAKIGALQA